MMLMLTMLIPMLTMLMLMLAIEVVRLLDYVLLPWYFSRSILNPDYDDDDNDDDGNQSHKKRKLSG